MYTVNSQTQKTHTILLYNIPLAGVGANKFNALLHVSLYCIFGCVTLTNFVPNKAEASGAVHALCTSEALLSCVKEKCVEMLLLNALYIFNMTRQYT